MGAITGGLMGGLSSIAAGGSFLEGFENGAFTGAITGAIFGGIGGVGRVLGSSCEVLKALGSVVKVIPHIAKISSLVSMSMAGFDLLAFSVGLFDPNNPLVQLNQRLHSSTIYNAFQTGVSAIAVFTGGFTEGMKKAACFVAGTMILTASGFVAIEKIRTGDKVISTNTDTFETAEKTVVETYIREVPQLVHLTVHGELISTTVEHPFYVKDQGFKDAVELKTGDMLVDSNCINLVVENALVEVVEKPVTVYNFQVEDFHTYHVGACCVLVHNGDYEERVARLKESAEKGKAFEEQEFPKLEIDKKVEQITIRTGEGAEATRFRIDAIGLDSDGVAPIEFKSSATAPLTPNQRAGFPQLEVSGGTVVGKGKGIFTDGYIIPAGTVVRIIRPPN